MAVTAVIGVEPLHPTGADDLLIEHGRVYGFAGDHGYTMLHATSDLATLEITRTSAVSQLLGPCVDGDTWWAAGEAGKLYTSTDRGALWRGRQLPTKQQLRSVVRHGGMLYVVGADGFCVRGDGKAWSVISLPGAKPSRASGMWPSMLSRMRVVGGELYVLGRGIWRITGDKATCEVTSRDLVNDLAQLADGTRVAVGENGVVLRAAPGKKLERKQVGEQDFVGVVAVANGFVAARIASFDNDTLIIASKTGEKWKSIPLVTADGARATGRNGFSTLAVDASGGVIVAGYRGLLARVAPDGLGPWRASTTPATVKPTRTTVAVVHTDLTARDVASSGDKLFLAMPRAIGVIGKTAKIAYRRDIEAHALFADGKEIWAGGRGLWRSTDGGKTFEPVALPNGFGAEIAGIARDPSGAIWVAGGFVLTGGADGMREVEIDARIRGAITTPFGALLLATNGIAYVANDGAVRPLALRPGKPLSDACITPAGTLIVVGHAGAFRSVDQGATFSDAATAQLEAVTALPDGRVIAVGAKQTLLVSTDDGAAFVPLEAPEQATANDFETVCAHRGEAYAGGRTQILVRLT